MVFVLSLCFFSAAVLFLLRTYQPGENQIVLSTTIDRPVSSVFKVIEDIRRIPVWHRQPLWLPASLRTSRMSRWGEHIPGARRGSGNHAKAPEDIRIRCIRNREFGYRSTCPRGLSCESTFYLLPDDGKCRLIWELRYQVHRLPDILSRSALASAAHASMATSMQYIERLVISSQDPVYARSGIYEASRGQIPAA